MASLTLMQLNDIHGYLEPHHELFYAGGGFRYGWAGGYARIAHLLDTVRREHPGNVLLLDSGDTLHGTFPVVQSQGAVMPPILNRLGIEAMTAHWEFAYGPAVLAERIEELNSPLLAANVYRQDSGEQPFPPAVVRTVGGLRIGIIGLACPIVDKTMPAHFSTGLRFELGRAELPGLVARLRHDERVDLVVLLSHVGFPQDMQLLREVGGIDVCLSGHTHNRLHTPAVVNGTLLIQSGSHGAFLGRLDLEIESGKIVDYRHRLLTVDERIPEDRDMAELIDETMRPHREMLGEVVGHTESNLNWATSMEATMDNMLLDALVWSTGAAIAFSNGWRYGAPIPRGKITMNDLWNVLPVNPPVSTVDLRGDEIIEMLEENLERTYSRDPYSQMGGYAKRVAGMNVYVRVENPKGQRIQRLMIGNEPVEATRVYPAAYVTEQGVGPGYGTNRQDTGMQGIEALRAWVQGHSPVRAELRGSMVQV